MAAFRFRLASVLRLRETARDERRRQLAEAYQAEAKLRERRETVERDIAEMKRLEGATVGQVNLDRLVAAHRYEAVLLAEIQVIRGHEARLAAEIEQRRLALVTADREVRVLEKLRETQHQRQLQHDAAVLAKTLDEVASRRAGSLHMAEEERF